jgi:hypothetical protein
LGISETSSQLTPPSTGESVANRTSSASWYGLAPDEGRAVLEQRPDRRTHRILNYAHLSVFLTGSVRRLVGAILILGLVGRLETSLAWAELPRSARCFSRSQPRSFSAPMTVNHSFRPSRQEAVFHHDVLDLGGQIVNRTKSSTVLQAIVSNPRSPLAKEWVPLAEWERSQRRKRQSRNHSYLTGDRGFEARSLHRRR